MLPQHWLDSASADDADHLDKRAEEDNVCMLVTVML